MIYLKSALAGIAAVVLVIVVLVASFAAWRYFLVSGTGSGGIGAVSVGLDALLVPVFVAIIFCLGFSWQFRRASAKK